MENDPPEAERVKGTPYHRAARFDGRWAERDAERAYKQTRRDLHRSRPDVDLSVFQLQIGNLIGDVAYLGWYVALIGTRPDEQLEARLERHLATGTGVELPEEVLAMLRERREVNAKDAAWVERRYGEVTRAELHRRPMGEEEHDSSRGRR